MKLTRLQKVQRNLMMCVASAEEIRNHPTLGLLSWEQLWLANLRGRFGLPSLPQVEVQSMWLRLPKNIEDVVAVLLYLALVLSHKRATIIVIVHDDYCPAQLPA